MLRQRYRNGVKGCKSYPGADAFTDHSLVAMQVRVKLKILKRVRRKQRWNIVRLKRNSMLFQRSIEDAIIRNTGMEVNQRWEELKE